MWVTVSELPRSVSHSFHEKLNRLLAEHGFDDFVEAHAGRSMPKDGAAQSNTGAILSAFVTWVFRGAGLGARHCVASGGLLGSAQVSQLGSPRRRRITPRYRGRGD